MKDKEGMESCAKKRIVAPDGIEHIVSLPNGHWETLDWLEKEGFTDLETQVEIAWRAWSTHRHEQPDIPFEHALGYAIQEAYEQYESRENGFTNDNK